MIMKLFIIHVYKNILQFKGLIFTANKRQTTLCCLGKLISKNLNSDQILEARTGSKYYFFREMVKNKSLIKAPMVDE